MAVTVPACPWCNNRFTEKGWHQSGQIFRKSAKENANVPSTTADLQLVALILQSGAIKPLQKKRKQDDVIIRTQMQKRTQTGEWKWTYSVGSQNVSGTI